VRTGLGQVYLASGRPGEARAALEGAVELARRIDDKPSQARALDALGQACQILGDLGQARRHWVESHTLYSELGAAEADQVRARLDGWQNR
jgi:predicted Zn-dependent protease